MIDKKIVEGSPGIRTPYSCESTSAQVHKSDPQFPDQEQTLHRPLYPETSYCHAGWQDYPLCPVVKNCDAILKLTW